MLRKTLMVGGVLIGLYIIVANYKGFSADENAAATGGTSLVKSLQGR